MVVVGAVTVPGVVVAGGERPSPWMSEIADGHHPERCRRDHREEAHPLAVHAAAPGRGTAASAGAVGPAGTNSSPTGPS